MPGTMAPRFFRIYHLHHHVKTTDVMSSNVADRQIVDDPAGTGNRNIPERSLEICRSINQFSYAAL